MLRFFTNNTCPIGVDMGNDALTLVQMAKDTDGLRLFAADRIEYPSEMRPGSTAWQRWAVGALGRSVTRGRFQGRRVIAAQPACDVFVDTMKMPESVDGELHSAIINRLRPKLQIDPDDALIRHFRNDSENIFVMVSDKTKLYQHLAVYEKAQLKVEAISIGPIAVLGVYRSLWAGKMAQDDPVMLLDIGQKGTKVTICDSANIYFAHASSVGATALKTERMVDLLNSEMDMCRVKFKSTFRRPKVNRIIFVSGPSVDKDIYAAIAKRAQMSAHIGDCLDAVGATRSDKADPKSLAPNANWITAMGLSLPEIQLARRSSHA